MGLKERERAFILAIPRQVIPLGEGRGPRPMKITVDVDCTPLEARQFMGLPDVEPMQKAAMAEIEKRMMAELERFSPEALFKAWLPIAGMNAEWLQEFFKRASP
jgi:uncharacterized protein DUF6489